jgi:putative membrane protein
MTEWERLDARMLLIGPTRVVRQFAIPFIVALVGIRTSDGGFGTWLLPFLVLGALVLGALPWLTTYFRHTDTQLQVRRGVLRRTVVTAPLDRVRSVDLESSLLHRLLGLTTVTIGTGVDETRIELDSLATRRADLLRLELLRRAPVAVPGTPPAAPPGGAVPTEPPAHAPAPATAPPTAEELARIDWSWLRFAPFSLSRLVVVAAGFGALSQVFDNLPLDRVDDAWQWLGSQALPLLVGGIAVACLVGWVVVSVGGYVLRWWDLRLVREDGNLRLTAGLFTTRSTSVEEARVRGVLLTEPVLLRAVGGAELSTLATGVGSGGVTTVLPPCPLPVATRVGAAVLEDPRPLTVALLPHGDAARRRCHWRSQRPTMLALAATLVAWVVGVPGELVVLGFAAVVLLGAAGVAAGIASYRHLGHALAPDHLVSGAGALQRSGTVLERDGIIGWVVRQSWFQRRVGLATLVATTAAGPESVAIVDLPLARAVALADAATPGMLGEVLAPGV